MKLKNILPVLLIALITITSCSSDDDANTVTNEVENLVKIQDIVTEEHTIELYNASGTFYTGHNEVTIRIKDNESETYFEDYNVTWKPIMTMPSMKHSCPFTNFKKIENTSTVQQAMVIFQMTFEDGSGWHLEISYTINGVEYTATETITVMQSELQNVTTFLGADQSRYILALTEPKSPIIGSNEIMVGLYKMENMMSFPVVEDYYITLDPRMPGMGNHSSPNNQNLSYTNPVYKGVLNLTMSGYWVLNLQLFNTANDLLKGEEITDTNTKSSLFLEIEF